MPKSVKDIKEKYEVATGKTAMAGVTLDFPNQNLGNYLGEFVKLDEYRLIEGKSYVLYNKTCSRIE